MCSLAEVCCLASLADRDFSRHCQQIMTHDRQFVSRNDMDKTRRNSAGLFRVHCTSSQGSNVALIEPLVHSRGGGSVSEVAPNKLA